MMPAPMNAPHTEAKRKPYLMTSWGKVVRCQAMPSTNCITADTKQYAAIHIGLIYLLLWNLDSSHYQPLTTYSEHFERCITIL